MLCFLHFQFSQVSNEQRKMYYTTRGLKNIAMDEKIRYYREVEKAKNGWIVEGNEIFTLEPEEEGKFNP